ncbi:MAG TPA: hypothetical protein VFO67_08120 [Gemmatimonadales bacterium]|nr:hypothetical protein [Gemmatimonadales bacterium]
MTAAIDRMTPEERAIFVRWLAGIALDHALEDLRLEGEQPSISSTERNATTNAQPPDAGVELSR